MRKGCSPTDRDKLRERERDREKEREREREREGGRERETNKKARRMDLACILISFL